MSLLRVGIRRVGWLAFVATIFAGSLITWIAIPAGCVWLANRTTRSLAGALAEILTTTPLSMFAFAMLLAKVQSLYAGRGARQRSAWLTSLSGARAAREPRPVLEVSMTISAVIALVALLVWFLFFAHSSLPASP